MFDLAYQREGRGQFIKSNFIIAAFAFVMLIAFADMATGCYWCPRKANIYIFCEDQYQAELAQVAQGLADVLNTPCFTLGSFAESEIEYAFSLTYYNEAPDFGSKCNLSLWYVGGQVDPAEQTSREPKLGWHVQTWTTAIQERSVQGHLAPLRQAISQSRPLHDIVWDWEGAPTHFELDTENICIDPKSQLVTFYLKDVKLHGGRSCTQRDIHDVNRLVFKIEGSEDVDWQEGEKMAGGEHASPHNDCTQKFIMDVPRDASFNEIKITAYNSCEIRKKEVKPLTETPKRDEICHKTIRNQWRLPKYCEIELEKEKIQASETMTISIKKIEDAMAFDSQPYDRLFVKVKKGSIQNGKKLGGMNAFDVGNSGAIQVKYQAPDDCQITEDEITVYTSCSTSDSAATEPGEEIKHKKIKIFCEFTWTGTMTIETHERFSCEFKDDNKNATRTINYYTDRTQRAMLNIEANDILPGDQVMDSRMASDWQVDGSLMSKLEDSYDMESQPKKQGDPTKEKSKTTIDRLFILNSDNVQMTISHDPGDFEAAGKEMQQMAADIAASGGDSAKIQQAMDRVNQMFYAGESSAPLRFIVQLNGNWIGPIEQYKYREANGKVEEDGTYTTTGPAALPMAVEFKGTITKDKSGGGQLSGYGSDSYKGPAGTAIECPDRQYSWTASINLTARKKDKGE